jgi:phosphate-selective porin
MGGRTAALILGPDRRAVRGGRGVELMPGLNWYLTKNLRMQLNYGHTHVQDGPRNGNLHLVQARLDVSL